MSSNIQTCNVSPKRLIHIIIFMLTILNCYQTEDPYLKRCWITIKNYRYRSTQLVISVSLQECKDYCKNDLRDCNLVVFDAPAGNKACSVTNSDGPVNHSLFQRRVGINTYILDLDCSRDVPSCWTMKGDYTFNGLHHFGDQNETLESCKTKCIHDFPNCDVINYAYPEFRGDGCYIKIDEGPLDKFEAMETMTSFVLNRTCLLTVEENQTQSAGSDDSSGKSFTEKYYAYVLAGAATILLLTGVLIAVGRNRKFSTSSEGSNAPEN